MSGGKKRSGFQITSVTSEVNPSPVDQLSPSAVLHVIQSEASFCSPQGSSSQPTTPSQKRKYLSHDVQGQGVGPSSRFRVVRLAGGASNGGRGESFRRGRWTCMEFTERQEGAGFRRVMDNMRHAHSLESLEMIGWDRERGGAYSQDTSHVLAQPTSGQQTPSSAVPDSTPQSHPQRRPPSTPPLPLRSLQLVAKQQEPLVVLRDHRKVKGHASTIRESWPGAVMSTSELKPSVSQQSLTPPSRAQQITEAHHRHTNQPQPFPLSQNPLRHTAPHPHWSVPVRAPPTGRGSEATMMALLLFCHR
uniref:TSC22 domain family member 4 n=1 Tax=Amphilophus citrinellus TaxID=61819 RepID=A0A3Q0TDK6_AMPCI